MKIIDNRKETDDTLLVFANIKVGQTFNFLSSKDVCLKTGRNQYFDFNKSYTHVGQFEDLPNRRVKLVETELHILRDK
jgi:hypothetical protein